MKDEWDAEEEIGTINEPALGVKRGIIQRKLALYQNAIYDAQLDWQIAQMLKDDRAENNAKVQIRRLLKVVRMLEQTLANISEGVEQVEGGHE